jgi:DNA-binding MarR family transcriptional regulator
MESGHEWTFFTNHAHVLVSLVADPSQSLREVALGVGITERAVQRIVNELEAAGYLKRERVGRRNCYEIHMDKKMRHVLEAHCTIGQILKPVLTAK